MPPPPSDIRAASAVVSVRAADLVEITTAALVAAGAPEDIGRTVARISVDADLDGRSTHGVGRIPAFIAKIRAGGLDPSARPQIIGDHGAALVVDGRDGFGHVALADAASKVADRALQVGVAMATIRNIANPGMLAAYGRIITDRGCIGILGCNAAAAMAPHGARAAFLGTNPLCVAVPVAGEGPLLLDMASTATSKAAVARAARRGEPIPEGWATDAEGVSTTDAAVALRGLLLPAAGPKGSGLALVVDILAGLLAGAAAGPDVRGFQDPGRSGSGAFVLAVDPAAFGQAAATFLPAVAGHLAKVRALPPTDPGQRPRTPGERANRDRVRHLRTGIPMEAELLQTLRSLARERTAEQP